MTTLRDLLRNPSTTIQNVVEHLGTLDGKGRTEQIRELASAELARLYDLAEGHRPLSFDDVVPPSTPALVGVPHPGKNNLPVFTYFAKVFCKPDNGAQGELWGYNASGPIPDMFAGPGYFVLRKHDVEGELLVDYTRVPPHGPSGWPEVKPNERGIVPRATFGNMGDVLRSVTSEVSIGRAYRNGKAMNNWFALNRES